MQSTLCFAMTPVGHFVKWDNLLSLIATSICHQRTFKTHKFLLLAVISLSHMKFKLFMNALNIAFNIALNRRVSLKKT